MSKIPLYLTYIWGSFFSILSFATLLKHYYWAFDVLTHFHIQYFIALAICIVLCFLLRSSLFCKLVFTLAFLFNAYLLVPYFLTQPKLSSTSSLGIATLNIFTENTNYQNIIDYVRESNLDFIFFSEIEPALMDALHQLSDIYPYTHDEAMEGTHGLAFISKIPFQGETIPLDERHHRFIKARLKWQKQEITIYAAHPHPPLAARWTKSRNDELAVIQQHIQKEINPHIFLGDFNASPWSQPLQQFFRETTLIHAAKGFGLYPTWRYKTMLLSAPIDHILVSPQWKILDYALKGDIDSDHFPVVAEVLLP